MAGTKKAKNIKVKLGLIAIASWLFAMSGCGMTDDLAADDAAPEITEELSGDTANGEEVFDISSFTSEEELRNALSSLTDDDLEWKSQIYDVLYRNFDFDENSYIEYADICGKLGDTKKQRELLWMLYRLEPTKEHGDLISDSVYIVDELSEQAGFIDSINNYLALAGNAEFDLSQIKEVLSSEEWRENFFLDTGIYTSHTRLQGDYTADVYSDQVKNTIIINGNGRRTGISVTAVGCTVFSTGEEDNGYSGDFYIAEYDELDNMTGWRSGTIENGHLTGDITLSVGGVIYSGSVDSEGHTLEEQIADVGGVIYAYDDAGQNYLYVADADADSWIADLDFINIEETKG